MMKVFRFSRMLLGSYWKSICIRGSSLERQSRLTRRSSRVTAFFEWTPWKSKTFTCRSRLHRSERSSLRINHWILSCVWILKHTRPCWMSNNSLGLWRILQRWSKRNYFQRKRRSQSCCLMINLPRLSRLKKTFYNPKSRFQKLSNSQQRARKRCHRTMRLLSLRIWLLWMRFKMKQWPLHRWHHHSATTIQKWTCATLKSVISRTQLQHYNKWRLQLKTLRF